VAVEDEFVTGTHEFAAFRKRGDFVDGHSGVVQYIFQIGGLDRDEVVWQDHRSFSGIGSWVLAAILRAVSCASSQRRS
jgi:hypothetical protein